jgi:hypothetical protein
MADTTYSVVLALGTTGSLNADTDKISEKLGKAEAHSHRLRHALTVGAEMAGRAFHVVGGVLEGIADKIVSVAEHAAVIGGGAMFAGAVYGVTKLNNELEQTTISLAAVFKAQGFTTDFERGMRMSADQVARMKVDVKTLPGDLGQLSNIMNVIATPAAQGGMNPDAIRKLAGETMLVSTILRVPLDMAGREMANLLAGRATGHNVLGTRLGLIGARAHQFNAETPEARVKDIENIFSKYKSAEDAFAGSFIARWTTLKDNIKYGFLADATAPLFDAVKGTISKINTWFDNNQDRVKSWANAFGTHLASSWNMLTSAAHRFGPALDNLGRRFFDLWSAAINNAYKLEPIIDKVAGFLARIDLKDITHAATTVAEMKLAGMGLNAIGSGLGMASRGMMMYNLSRLAAGGGKGGAAAGEGGGAGGILGGLTFGDALVTGVAGLAAFTVALGTAKGALENIVDPNAKAHDRDVNILKRVGDKLPDGLLDSMQKLSEPGLWNRVADGGLILIDMLQQLGQAFNPLSSRFALNPFGANFGTFYVPGANVGPADYHDLTKGDANVPAVPKREDPQEKWEQLLNDPKMRHRLPGGGGGTNIQKVEIIVKGNDDPSRVARLTREELLKLARNPTRSPYAPAVSR